MDCKCTPIQKEPHIVRGGGGKAHFIKIPIMFKIDKTYDKKGNIVKRTLKATRNLVLLQWMIYKTMPVDCNRNEVKKWGYIS